MSYREEDVATMAYGRFIVEGHINYLDELDPTHITAQPVNLRVSNASQAMPVYRASLPSHMLLDDTAAAVLLELDPTHLPVR